MKLPLSSRSIAEPALGVLSTFLRYHHHCRGFDKEHLRETMVNNRWTDLAKLPAGEESTPPTQTTEEDSSTTTTKSNASLLLLAVILLLIKPSLKIQSTAKVSHR
eukprot:GHVS01004123.1.p1 GENE.GHVS01004123.1~~GHVS01004123.1.p1  ORF type:complete len:105 (+),score=22.29 GHVS01004123.1:1-315(+)